jgi:hypothetical protein
MKKITVVNYLRGGVTYKTTFNGHLTPTQVQTSMLMERHVPKYNIKNFQHTAIRVN